MIYCRDSHNTHLKTRLMYFDLRVLVDESHGCRIRGCHSVTQKEEQGRQEVRKMTCLNLSPRLFAHPELQAFVMSINKS